MVFTVFIAFFLSVLDGFDVISISVAATALSQDWGISRGQLGPIFSAALIGMAIGAAILAPYSDKIGRRKVILMATLLLSAAMVATGLIKGGLPLYNILGWEISGSILLLILVRFVAGLGVGVIFANAATIASEAVPERHRDFAVLIAIMGYPFGAMIVGPVANAIISSLGWEMVFILGGLASLIMSVIIFLFLPESVDFLASKTNRTEKELNQTNKILKRYKRDPIEALPSLRKDGLKAASVKSLLSEKFRIDTYAIWSCYFLGFLAVYFILTWVPTLFVDSGYTRGQGIQALTYNNLGAVLGALVIGIWAKKVKLAKPISIFFACAAISLAVIWGFKVQNATHLNALMLINGFFLQGAFIGLYALAARYYPTTVRATGIGWGAGFGRVGAILSPILAGILAANGWSMYALFLLFAFPLVLASVAVLRFKV